MTSLRRRLTLFTSIFLTLIIVVFNIFVYVFVNNITLESEQTLMRNKLNILRENADLYDPQKLSSLDLLADFYDEDEVLRIVNRDGKVVNLRGTDSFLVEQPISNYYLEKSYVKSLGTARLAYMSFPLIADSTIIGKVELYRDLHNLDYYMRVLIFALFSTALAAILFSIIGSFWFSSRLIEPIQVMVRTMREINRSGKLKEIQLAKRSGVAELAMLATAFNSMVTRIDRVLQRQRHFVADASHELKTPITVITSYAEMLKRWGMNDESVREEAIESILNQSERLSNLTRSMLTLAESSQDDWLQPSRFDLIALADETATMLNRTFNRKIHVRASREHLELVADKSKLQQLLVILIDNAIKYSKAEIDVHIRLVRDRVQLSVSDKGIGISEDEIPNLFERFYRVDSARSRKTGGVGLGLSIAKRIVELHEGTIEVNSVLNKGTTFIIMFPYKK